MKKTMLSAALLAAALVFPFVSCNNSYVESSPETTPEEKEDKPVPLIGPDFVYIEGTTVEGGDKFTVNGNTGVFVKDRTVTIADFFMCNHEVTQAEFEAVMGVNPSMFSSDPAEGEKQEKRPVEGVSWYDAIAYCNKKSASEHLTPCYTINGITDWKNFDFSSIPTSYNSDWNAVVCDFSANGYRLPTEVEWEYAALGGKKGIEADDPTDWSGTNDSTKLGIFAWYSENSKYKTHEVMTKKENDLGLYDMTGNVWEMLWDRYSAIINENTPITGPTEETQIVITSGGPSELDARCIINTRAGKSFTSKLNATGFRVARSK